MATVNNYYKEKFPSHVRTKLEATAFRSLCVHLRERSDDVQNIDLMIISGFCRNCLAKWLVVAARQLSKDATTNNNDTTLIKNLNAFGYDEAAEEIYGCTYPEWKKKHAKKATSDQVDKYNQIVDTHLHARHDKNILQKETKNNEEFRIGQYYYQHAFSQDIREEMEARTFRCLCQHLSERSHLISNIDLMTISGFCRNCLAKWLVLAARNYSKEISSNPDDLQQTLDSFGYDEAAEEIYGCAYSEWKKNYATKATDEQMEKYKESTRYHAKHDKELLKKRMTVKSSSSLMSNVCCEDVDNNNNNNSTTTLTCARPTHASSSSSSSSSTIVPSFHSYQPPPPPQNLEQIRVAILTVSDRAFQNLYSTGDLSGPAIKDSIAAYYQQTTTSSWEIVAQSIVPDEMDAIQSKLREWSSSQDVCCDVIFTSGGTGFSPRDVTPEATLPILDRECTGLMSWVSGVCSTIQPFAALSRGTAGIRNDTMIVNLPGNPQGVHETMSVVFPIVLHAICDLQQNNRV